MENDLGKSISVCV